MIKFNPSSLQTAAGGKWFIITSNRCQILTCCIRSCRSEPLMNSALEQTNVVLHRHPHERDLGIFNDRLSRRRFTLPVCCPSDVDECGEQSSCCEQDCANYPGGYECYCSAGYRLSSDGCSCDGMWDVPWISILQFCQHTDVTLSRARCLTDQTPLVSLLFRCRWVSGSEWRLWSYLPEQCRILSVFLPARFPPGRGPSVLHPWVSVIRLCGPERNHTENILNITHT